MTSSRALRHSFQSPSFGLLATEPLRALFDLAASHIGPRPDTKGDGHPVIVYPGLGGGALTTARLRECLKHSGFVAHDWEGGVNTGPEGFFDEWLGHLGERVRHLHERHGRKVSLIGWSLGGIYAREIAKNCPESVRQVITLGTPFAAFVHGNHAGSAFRLLNRDRAQVPPNLQARLRERPPVPTTSIYSKNDGIVSWRGCLERATSTSESIEVHASHLGMGTHPEVLRVIVDRLSQPDGHWKPLKPHGRLRARDTV